MKQTILILTAFMATGCGRIDRGCSSLTGDPSEVCWGGVKYLQFTSGATVKVDSTGKPVTCTK